MNWLKQKILGLLRVELDAAYQMLRDERDSHKSTKSYCKYLSNEYDRMKKKTTIFLKSPNTGARKQTQSSSYSPISSAR